MTFLFLKSSGFHSTILVHSVDCKAISTRAQSAKFVCVLVAAVAGILSLNATNMVCRLWWSQSGWSVGAPRRCEERQHIGKMVDMDLAPHRMLCYILKMQFNIIINSLSSQCFLQLLQQLKRLICDLCRLYNLPQHPDVEMLDQPLPAGPITQDRKVSSLNKSKAQESFVDLSYSLFFNFQPSTAWVIRWGDFWRGRRRRNGRGNQIWSIDWSSICSISLRFWGGFFSLFWTNVCVLLAGYWSGPRPGPLRNERRGAGGWKEVRRWRDRKRKSGYLGENP